MPLYAVCHVNPKPPHSLVKVAARGAHNLRQTIPPNVDATRTPENAILFGPTTGDISEVLAEKISGQKLKKNTRLVGELILSATREFFESDDQKIDRKKVDAWAKAEMDWLQNHHQYGRNLLSVALHMDEATPHIHALVVPQRENGSLCYREFWGMSCLLKNMHDSHAKAVAALGLSRGQEASKSKHDDIEDYRKRVAAAKKQVEEMQPEPIAPETEAMIRAKIVEEEFSDWDKFWGVKPVEAVERIRKREETDRQKERAWAAEKIRESAAKGEAMRNENRRLANELARAQTRAKAEAEKAVNLESALKETQKENARMAPLVERLEKMQTVAQGWAQTIVDGNPAELKALRKELTERGMRPTLPPTPSHSHGPSLG